MSGDRFHFLSCRWADVKMCSLLGFMHIMLLSLADMAQELVEMIILLFSSWSDWGAPQPVLDSFSDNVLVFRLSDLGRGAQYSSGPLVVRSAFHSVEPWYTMIFFALYTTLLPRFTEHISCVVCVTFTGACSLVVGLHIWGLGWMRLHLSQEHTLDFEIAAWLAAVPYAMCVFCDSL